jgi:hypothetical protein
MTLPENPGPGTYLPPAVPYTQPAVSVRATFLATDGSRPEEIIVEWRDDPREESVAGVMEMIASIAAGTHVEIMTKRAEPAEDQPAEKYGYTFERPTLLREQTAPLKVVPKEDPLAQDEVFCGATGPGHDTEGHGCSMAWAHDPVEPAGRWHRCLCGGLFSTEAES